MTRTKFSSVIVFLLGIVVIGGCNKSKLYNVAVPPAFGHFLTDGGTFYVRNTSPSTFKVPVGTTANSNSNRIISFTVSSPTGAASGVQYSLGANSVTIPGGKVVDSISINGIFAGFPGSRIDTLVLKIGTGDGLDTSSYKNTYRLVLQKYCNVVLSAFAGNYLRSNEVDESDPANPYGPFEIDVTSGTVTGSKGYLLMDNIGDWGGFSTRVDLDWTADDNFKTTIPDQFMFVHPTYGNARIRGVGNGTFSSCDNSLSIRYEVYVSAGSFGIFTSKLMR